MICENCNWVLTSPACRETRKNYATFKCTKCGATKNQWDEKGYHMEITANPVANKLWQTPTDRHFEIIRKMRRNRLENRIYLKDAAEALGLSPAEYSALESGRLITQMIDEQQKETKQCG